MSYLHVLPKVFLFQFCWGCFKLVSPRLQGICVTKTRQNPHFSQQMHEYANISWVVYLSMNACINVPCMEESKYMPMFVWTYVYACEYVCMHVCMCVCMWLYMYVCTCMCVIMYTCMCVCMLYVCMYVYVCKCVCMYVYTYVCVCMCLCICIDVWMYVWLWVCICLRMLVFMYVSVLRNLSHTGRIKSRNSARQWLTHPSDDFKKSNCLALESLIN